MTKFCLLAALLVLVGCGEKPKSDPKAEAPPPAQVEKEADANQVKADHPEQFALVTAMEYSATPELNVTGVVAADVARQVPVISLASGRIVEINTRLGDTVTKGQLLMKVQSSDISAAYSDYQQAIADEKLARSQVERSKALLDHGAIAQKDYEVAQNADEKAKVMVATTAQRLRVLGVDPASPSAIVNVYAPVSGVVTDQQVTAAAGTQGLSSPNAFTISDLSYVWILCDVYENDLSQVRLGEFADVRLNAYPDQVFKGRIANIGAVLDPALRTAKVRLELRNPGMMRLGMFVQATFHGLKAEKRTAVPADAILHLHDRDWVYVPDNGQGRFRRVNVVGGRMLPDRMQEVLSGLDPGQRVVAKALTLQNTVEQ